MRQAVTSTGYNPDFDVDLGRGQKGERLVAGIYTALFDGTVEVKKDYGSHETGYHYVETAQQSDDGTYRPSGINTTKADWWALVGPDEKGMIVIDTMTLKRLAHNARKAKQPISSHRTRATRGRLVPVRHIVAAVVANSFAKS